MGLSIMKQRKEPCRHSSLKIKRRKRKNPSMLSKVFMGLKNVFKKQGENVLKLSRVLLPRKRDKVIG